MLTYYQDEARFGPHGTFTRVWAKVGSRPPAIRQTQYDYLGVFSAVGPETGDAAGLITPHINIDTMNAFREQFSAELPPDVHAAMVLDRAGWHTASALRVPPSVTLVLLPPKSPELNPAEKPVALPAKPLLVQQAIPNVGRPSPSRRCRQACPLPRAAVNQVGLRRHDAARELTRQR